MYKLKNIRRMLIISFMVAVVSQVNLGLMNSEFVVSAGIIVFVSSLGYYADLNPVPLGVLSGIMVYLSRIIISYLSRGPVGNLYVAYMLEILFYLFYSIFYSILVKKGKMVNLIKVYGYLLFCDFSANVVEGLVRYLLLGTPYILDVIPSLLVASVIRSTIIILYIGALRYYASLLKKEEHEERYKKLLWLTSQFKAETYWIEKNLDSIEKVMSQSYKLFEEISSETNKDRWAESALNIAREVHEIKKENGLVIRGIREITENELSDTGMYYKDINEILYKSMKREVVRHEKNILLDFEYGEDFYTSNHYYLMSVLRNLIMNAMDAIELSENEDRICLYHETDNGNHIFIVSDTGSGIDEDGLEHIFSPGFSTKINYNTGEINRGLGLSIVQYIVVNQLGGTIDVSSKLGQGTSFKITIPAFIMEGEKVEDILS